MGTFSIWLEISEIEAKLCALHLKSRGNHQYMYLLYKLRNLILSMS